MIPPTEELRDLGPDDADALARFFEMNNRPETTANFHPFPLEAAVARQLAEHRGRDRYFALFRDAEVLGFGMLRGWDEGFAIPSFGVLIDSREQGRGLGRQLTRHALALSGGRVRLSVSSGNIRARTLYEDLGFVVTETTEDGRLIMHWEQPTP